MPQSETAAAGTPLAPSVEKAYYRKCIQLKRRLNEVETANDEAKVRTVRLDRSIMKMRLERAFLLEQLSKRMEHNVDDSEGSADEGMATPPPDRPHRDKRRRHGMPPGAPDSSQPSHPTHASPYGPQQTPQLQRGPSDPAGNPPMVQGPGGFPIRANALTSDGQYIYVPPAEHAQSQAPAYPMPPAPLPHGSPYGPPIGVPGAAPTHMNGMSADDGAEQPTPSAGQRIPETTNGHPNDAGSGGGGGGGFTAVNG
ncbi:hypothetical protein LTR36_008065 [Oleoguttula mirabilis]|uniref:INO80 complex subunit F domain-containing protein n=1 Tax=Oleoguttula mirabilis TaxID=1507867 RepID=A0AAV9J8V5_9PEZI|nr:hypothetical protein LTR36_008065 [Oleoguttula mirabilis]